MVLVGVQGMVNGGSVIVVTLAMALGCLIGYRLDIDGHVHRLGQRVQRRLNERYAGSERLGSFSEGFVAATLFTCTGAMAIMPLPFRRGRSLDQFARSWRRASSTWWSASRSPRPWYRECRSAGCRSPTRALSALAALLGSVVTKAIITQVVCTGSLLLFAVGTNLLKVTDIKVANMLPAAFVPFVLVPLMQMAGLV